MQTSIIRRALLAVLLLVLLAGLLPGRSHAQTDGGTAPGQVANPYGVNLLLDTEVEAVKVERTIALAAAANVGWIKQQFPWQDIEIAAKGDFTDKRSSEAKSAWDKYDRIVGYAEQYGVQVVARIDKAPQWAGGVPGNAAAYYDFLEAVLRHYNGRIKYIQVWNEPNLSDEWVPGQVPDPRQYTEFLRGAYQRIKQVDPSVFVISAPMAATTEPEGSTRGMNELTYWQRMYEAGAQDAFDIVSANAYGLADPPDALPSPETLNFRRVELLRQIMEQNGDGGKQVWFNEYGWNANPGPPKLSDNETLKYRQVTKEQQAQYTVDGITYARQNWPWAGVVFIWYLRQDGQRIPDTDSQYYFALVNPDFSTNPVYDAVAADAEKYRNAPPPPTPVHATFAPTPTGELPPSSTPGGGGGILEPSATIEAVIATSIPTAAEPTATTAAAQPTATSVAAEPTASNVAVAVPEGGSSGEDSSLPLILLAVLAVAATIGGVAYFMTRGGGSSPGSSSSGNIARK